MGSEMSTDTRADKSIGPICRELPARRLTYDEFLDWCDEDTWAEWVDGVVQMVSPANRRHAELATFLIQVLGFWSSRKKLGQIYCPPFQMRLGPPVQRGREPDVLIVKAANLSRVLQTYIDGPADLVVEIISPESIGRDRGDKFIEYEAGKVPEYWLLDPVRQQAEFNLLGVDGRYHTSIFGQGGTYVSPVLDGLRLPVEWLWQEPLPDLFDVLRELDLV